MEGYVALQWVAYNIVPSAYIWAKEGRLKVETIDRVKYVPQAVADKLATDLQCTCSLAEASRLIGISKGSMRFYIDHLGVVKTMEVAGRERVLLSSIEPAKEYTAGHSQRIRERNKRAAKALWAPTKEAREITRQKKAIELAAQHERWAQRRAEAKRKRILKARLAEEKQVHRLEKRESCELERLMKIVQLGSGAGLRVRNWAWQRRDEIVRLQKRRLQAQIPSRPKGDGNTSSWPIPGC